MAFLTKKAKAEMRARRQKKSKFDGVSGSNENYDDSSSAAASRKRKRGGESSAEDVVIDDDGDSKLTKAVADSSKGPLTIVVPATLTPKEGRKFRKDARRKARVEGQTAEEIRFVVEGSVEAEGGDGDDAKDTHLRKKRNDTKVFPRINELLAAHKVREKEEKVASKRQAQSDAVSESERSQYVAIDCEMVGVGAEGKQSVLARASAVDWEGTVLLDTFVVVPERVTDFRTKVSGVKAKDIRPGQSGHGGNKAMEPEECRRLVGELLNGKILVGHALKNDLGCLMLSHPRAEIRDTSRYAPFMRPSGRGGGKLRPRKLRDLALEHLGLKIQVAGESHCSIDDARAAMDLFKSARVPWERDLKRVKK